MNENRTHLLRPCAATALVNELSLNNSRARSSAANDKAVAAGIRGRRARHGRLESLAGHDEAEFVGPAELAQVGGGEGSVRQVDIFWMGGVRTSISTSTPPPTQQPATPSTVKSLLRAVTRTRPMRRVKAGVADEA